MKVLVTGAAGSAGSYLLETLLSQNPNDHYVAFVRSTETSRLLNLRNVIDRLTLVETDLLDFQSTLNCLETIQPDAIYHFASEANVLKSFREPLSVVHNNVSSTTHLLESLRVLQLPSRVLLCSTSEVYGQVQPSEVPIKESNPLRPASPYSVSKVSQDLLAQVYSRAYGLQIIITRMFSYLNPRRLDLFATSFAYQIARIEAGLQADLLHGNLDSVRTFIDVRDAMECYRLVMEKGVPGEVYNLGGSTTFRVGEVLELLKSKARCAVSSRVSNDLVRPVDITLQIPDTGKFKELTDWAPKYSFSESLDLLLNECRHYVAQVEAV